MQHSALMCVHCRRMIPPTKLVKVCRTRPFGVAYYHMNCTPDEEDEVIEVGLCRDLQQRLAKKNYHNRKPNGTSEKASRSVRGALILNSVGGIDH